MRLLIVCAVVSLASDAIASRSDIKTDTKVSVAFESYGFIPDIIPVAPEGLLTVTYPTAEICLGDEVAQTQTIVRPKFDFNLLPGINYTLIMIDPDVPSAQAPVLRSYILWLMVNISLRGGSFEGGISIADYMAPTPYPGSGYHRYTLLLYEQTGPIDLDALGRQRLGIRRYRFDIPSFSMQYGLGHPVAGNFFRIRLPALCEEYYCKA